MKNCMKALALILTIAICAMVPAIAEVSAEESIDIVALLGTDIDEAGTTLGMEKTQTEGEEDANLTLYESDALWLGGYDGVVVSIMVLDETYDVCGIKVGMTADDAKAALTEAGVTYTEGEVEEIGTPTIDFAVPGREDATVCIELDDDNTVMYARIDLVYDSAE